MYQNAGPGRGRVPAQGGLPTSPVPRAGGAQGPEQSPPALSEARAQSPEQAQGGRSPAQTLLPPDTVRAVLSPAPSVREGDAGTRSSRVSACGGHLPGESDILKLPPVSLAERKPRPQHVQAPGRPGERVRPVRAQGQAACAAGAAPPPGQGGGALWRPEHPGCPDAPARPCPEPHPHASPVRGTSGPSQGHIGGRCLPTPAWS